MTGLAFVLAPSRALPVIAALAGVAGVAVLAAVSATVSPVISLALTGVIAAAALVLGLGTRTSQFFRWTMAGLLLGYAFFGRGFAHMGFPPVFVGEVVLGLALLSLAVRGFQHRWSYLEWTLFAFMAWGAAQTLPYLGVHGVDALRDAAMWGYMTFAFVIAAHLTSRASFDRVIGIYAAVIPIFLLWVPLARVLAAVTDFSLARTGVPLIVFKGGDMAVHLAAVATFMLLGLYGAQRVRRIPVDLLWVAWFIGAGALVSGRAALLTLVAGIGITAVLRPNRRFAAFLWVGAVLVTAAVLFNISIRPGNEGVRAISVSQVITNMRSLVTDTDQRNNSTRDWRLEWWGEIVGYTLGGEYFWTGRGFGLNIAEEDGFGTLAGDLRSPHSSHMTVLARMGVPGLVLWIAVHSGFVIAIMRALQAARRRHDVYWQRIFIWILVYWSGAMVNGSFDVYLEGPQGAIWFWSVVGMGIAGLRISAAERAPAAPAATADRLPVSVVGGNSV